MAPTTESHGDRPLVLVVDDEPGIVEVLTYSLDQAGFDTIVATDGPTALRMALTTHPQLILLDVMLPGLDGLAVCREIRAASSVPIILVSAKGSDRDRIVGLDLQADDYIVKPFNIEEVIARIRAVLRRSEPAVAPFELESNRQVSGIVVGLLRLDNDAVEAFWDDRRIELTKRQFDLLNLFASRPKVVFTRSQLLELVWGYSFTDDVRTVDSMIKRLRASLREAGAPPELIASRRELGYCLAIDIAAPQN
jgi:DNA-binding response OmpR family regulator